MSASRLRSLSRGNEGSLAPRNGHNANKLLVIVADVDYLYGQRSGIMMMNIN